MKVSWVILTFNRSDLVIRAMKHNLACAGVRPDEIIWVDNGSDEFHHATMYGYFGDEIDTDVIIQNKKNLGVAKGYNRGFVLATGDLVVITGCDRTMPDKWLIRMKEAFEKVPNMACVSCYSEYDESRYVTQKKIETINEFNFMRALPFEARMIRREMLKDVGYFHEGFGLYGYEDCVWGPRLLRLADERNLICCTLPDFDSLHLGSSEIEKRSGRELAEYRAFKEKENREPWKWELVEKIAGEGYPKFNPYY